MPVTRTGKNMMISVYLFWQNTLLQQK